MNVFESIEKWNQERGLLDKAFNPMDEFRMLREELHEFYIADRGEEMIDALCDIIVVATGTILKMGYDPQIAMEETVKEISSRRGSINPETGKWEKDKNQPIESLYTANYDRARREE